MSNTTIIWIYVLVVGLTIIVSIYRKVRHIVDGHGNSQELRNLATSLNVKQWAQNHGLRYFNIGNHFRQAARMEVNHGKEFFRADDTMGIEDDGPYVEGVIQDRNVWLYIIVGRPRFASSHTISRAREVSAPVSPIASSLSRLSILSGGNSLETPTVHQLQQVLYAWCLEISTCPIPHRLRVTRHGLQEADELDIESRMFERRYDVNHFEDSLALQLLDPQMISLIEQSRADALEFSDNSVVIYELSQHTTADVLDTLLDSGLKIAEQVDRNYPLSKYAQKAN